MKTVEATKGNRILTIAAELADDYVVMGYTIQDEDGNMLKQPRTDKNELEYAKKQFEQFTKQFDSLKAEYESVMKENEDLKLQLSEAKAIATENKEVIPQVEAKAKKADSVTKGEK